MNKDYAANSNRVNLPICLFINTLKCNYAMHVIEDVCRNKDFLNCHFYLNNVADILTITDTPFRERNPKADGRDTGVEIEGGDR